MHLWNGYSWNVKPLPPAVSLYKSTCPDEWNILDSIQHFHYWGDGWEPVFTKSTGSAPWGRIPLRTRIKLWMCWRKHKNKIQFILGTCRTVYSGEILNWENPRCKISSSEVIVAVQKMGFWHRFLQEGAASTTGSRQEVLEQTSVKDI